MILKIFGLTRSVKRKKRIFFEPGGAELLSLRFSQ
jgi:hypothetical protein